MFGHAPNTVYLNLFGTFPFTQLSRLYTLYHYTVVFYVGLHCSLLIWLEHQSPQWICSQKNLKLKYLLLLFDSYPLISELAAQYNSDDVLVRGNWLELLQHISEFKIDFGAKMTSMH